MDAQSEKWREFFAAWPAELPHRGLLITHFGEQIPFSSFAVGSTFLMLERNMPDSLGARSVMFAFDQITALKIIDVVKPKQFPAACFETPSTKH